MESFTRPLSPSVRAHVNGRSLRCLHVDDPRTMRKDAKSVDRKIAATPRDPEAEKIGSGVFSLRGLPVSVPSVGTRRSTRVFVPKSVPKVVPDGDDLASRVLRSGKRLALWKPVEEKAVGDEEGDEDAWIQFFGSSGDTEHGNWCKGEKEGFEEKQGKVEGDLLECRWHAHSPDDLELEVNLLEESVSNRESVTSSVHSKTFGIVYSRKRQRSESDGSDSPSSHEGLKESTGDLSSLSDGLVSLSTESGDNETQGRRFGVVFVRNPYKKPEVSSTFKSTCRGLNYSDKGRDINKAARDFAEKVGILEGDLWLGLVGQTVLVVLLQATSSASAYRFTCFLVSILSGMMKKKVNLFKCAAFMSSRSVARVFSLHGIIFLPVRRWKSDFSRISDAGICVIFGARLLIPLVTVNFPAIPFLFKSLHLSMSLRSLYLPNVLARYQRQSCLDAEVEVSFEECRLYISHVHAIACASRMETTSSRSLAYNESDADNSTQVLPANKVSPATGSPQSAARGTTIINNVRFQKNQRKRSSLRSGGVPGCSLLKCHRSFVHRQNGMLKLGTIANVCPKIVDCSVEIHTEELASPLATPNQKKRRRTRKNSTQRSEELRSSFAEAKQNVDVLSCTANILVTERDKCWREDGVKVMLELISNEWCLAVKLGDTTRYLHKAQEMKPSAANRYTHSMMWTGDSGWKLEFCHKKDWNVFKELHKECCERNVQEVPVRIIPAPGVREVSGYEENLTSFVRPDLYIHMFNEVERVLMSENPCYDMDSGDEEWLEQLNSSALNGGTGNSPPISEDNFEKIVSTFEKAAYSHPDDVSEVEKAASLCFNFGRTDLVAAVFNYWLKKRKQKHSPLVRIFQGQPPRKTQLSGRPLLRRKRSLKRQGSHAERGKPEIFLKAAANHDAIRKYQEAEAVASRAVDTAIRLRNRAQVLLIDADLAAYKSVMALRVAESLLESESPDLSSILG